MVIEKPSKGRILLLLQTYFISHAIPSLVLIHTFDFCRETPAGSIWPANIKWALTDTLTHRGRSAVCRAPGRVCCAFLSHRAYRCPAAPGFPAASLESLGRIVKQSQLFP